MKNYIVPALLITITTVPVGLWRIYAYYKKILEKQYETYWHSIGTLKEILIYPLEGPQGAKMSSAFCSTNGLICYPDSRNTDLVLRDRSHLIYSTYSGKAVTLDPGLIKLSNIKVWTAMLRNGKKTDSPGNQLPPIRYLGNEISLKTFPNEVPAYIRRCIETSKYEILKFGRTDAVRSSFVPKNIEDGNYNGYESNFSTYTLVNLKSLEQVKKMLKRNELSCENFLPHFVIDCPAYDAFIEDKIVQLKIGLNVLFEKVSPCTHTKFIDIAPNKSITNFFGLFQAMQSTRAINKLYPGLSNSNAPVFGINLEIIKHPGFVYQDTPVYATFQFDKLSYCSQIKEIMLYITTRH